MNFSRLRYLYSVKCTRLLLAIAMSSISLTIISGQTSFAATLHCSGGWCSGSDSNTSVDTQQNDPQIYVGEVGEYQVSQSAMAFSSTGAANANAAAAANSGLGTDFYYFGNGPGDAPPSINGESQLQRDYCFGWLQGDQAENDIENYYFSYVQYASVIFFDMEIDPSDGWLIADSGSGSGATGVNAEYNRAIFNGFSDFVAGRTSKYASFCSGTGPTIYQYGVYSSPYIWHVLFDTDQNAGNLGPTSNYCNEPGGTYGGLANTFIWTSEGQYSTSSEPSSFTSGSSTTNACWFASSNYDVAQQYYTGNGANRPDYDVVSEPEYQYVLGYDWGS